MCLLTSSSRDSDDLQTLRTAGLSAHLPGDGEDAAHMYSLSPHPMEDNLFLKRDTASENSGRPRTQNPSLLASRFLSSVLKPSLAMNANMQQRRGVPFIGGLSAPC